MNNKYYPILAMAFVTLLLTSNIIGPKPVAVWGLTVPAGLIIFPLTYTVCGVITEVYGFSSSRKIIWTGLFSNMFLALCCNISIYLPYDKSWLGQEAYALTLGMSSRLMFISVFTYFIGEFINSYVITNLKNRLNGRLFWLRGLLGSWLGEFVETSIFLPLAFYQLPLQKIINMALFYYAFKLIYGVITVPIMVKLANYIKTKESLQYTSNGSYDKNVYAS